MSIPTLRRLPPLSYAIQNVLYSVGTIVASTASLFVTLFLIIPLSFLRFALLPVAYTFANGQPEGKKVVLVVGASRGIGFNVVKQYADEENATIIIVGRRPESLKRVQDQLGMHKANITTETLDLASDPGRIAEAVNSWDRKYHGITHLYAVSGTANDGSRPWNMDLSAKIVQTNVMGVMALIMSVYEAMKTRQSGKICIVSSTVGYFAPANMITYASTKSFLNTFATSLRVLALCDTNPIRNIHLNEKESYYGTAPENIEVTMVAPGFIDTQMTGDLRENGSTAPYIMHRNPEKLARRMKQAVERGGEGSCVWPPEQGLMLYSMRGINPICDELGRWLSWRLGFATQKVIT